MGSILQQAVGKGREGACTNLFFFKNLFHEQSGFRRHNDVITVTIVGALSLAEFLTWWLHVGTFTINIALWLEKRWFYREYKTQNYIEVYYRHRRERKKTLKLVSPIRKFQLTIMSIIGRQNARC